MLYKDSGSPKSVVKAIYLKLSVKIPQLYVYLCFKLKFIENHKILHPQNTHEKKKLNPRNTHKKKCGTHKIPTRKSFRPTIYPQENILDP